MGQLAAGLSTDPLRVAGARGDLTVEGHRGLEQHPRPSDPRVLAKRLVEQPRARGQLAVHEHDLHPLVAQDPETASRCLLGWIVGTDDHTPDPRLHDRVGAWGRLALVTARLQRHVQRRLAQVGQAARLDRVDLRMRSTELFVPALAERLAVARHHRADDRVGLDHAPAVARELDRARQVPPVGVRAGGHLCIQDNSAPEDSSGETAQLSARSDRRAAGRSSCTGPGVRRRAGSSRSSSRIRT